jgi:superfamily II DNA helicase RecQ
MYLKVLSIRKNYIEEDEEKVNRFFNSVYTLKPEVFDNGDRWSIFAFYNVRVSEEDKKKVEELEKEFKYSEKAENKIIFDPDTTKLTEEEENLLFKLKEWREQKAYHFGYPSYFIAHNSHLITIIKIKPKTLEDFLQVKGLSKKTIALFGQELINILTNK